LDASFLFILAQFKVDIFDELSNLFNRSFEPILLSSTKQELQGLAKSSPKIQKQAVLALGLSEKCKFVSVEKGWDEFFDMAGIVKTDIKELSIDHDQVIREAYAEDYERSQEE
jgi:rRNA-processing protein FCF1